MRALIDLGGDIFGFLPSFAMLRCAAVAVFGVVVVVVVTRLLLFRIIY